VACGDGESFSRTKRCSRILCHAFYTFLRIKVFEGLRLDNKLMRERIKELCWLEEDFETRIVSETHNLNPIESH
jgi:hypothetical protein